MKKLAKREFEVCVETGINVIICTVPFCKDCIDCINKDEWNDINKKYPFVKIYEYDISTDFDKCEEYKVLHTPAILIFRDGSLYDSFIFDNIEEVIEKLNIQKSDFLKYPNY